jgi:hypothetical protein
LIQTYEAWRTIYLTPVLERLLWVISGPFVMSDRCPLYPPKADIADAMRNVRFVPQADVRRLIQSLPNLLSRNVVGADHVTPKLDLALEQ